MLFRGEFHDREVLSSRDVGESHRTYLGREKLFDLTPSCVSSEACDVNAKLGAAGELAWLSFSYFRRITVSVSVSYPISVSVSVAVASSAVFAHLHEYSPPTEENAIAPANCIFGISVVVKPNESECSITSLFSDNFDP